MIFEQTGFFSEQIRCFSGFELGIIVEIVEKNKAFDLTFTS